MRERRNFRVLEWAALVAAVLSAAGPALKGESNFFPSFAGKHTVGLWLFDETDYPYTTLTDAGRYEYDLRFMKGGKLVKGRFGNCLKFTPGRDYAVGYAAWKGPVAFVHMREVSGRPGSGLWGPTIAPEQITKTLAERNWTCEFWIMLMSNPIQDVALIDLGDKFEGGFTVTLKSRAAGFVVENGYGGFRAICPTVLNQLWGRAWHHVAFTYSAGSDELGYFIDGRVQEPVKVSKIKKMQPILSVVPESRADTTYGIFEKEDRRSLPDFDKRIAHRFNFAIGHDRHGEHDYNGNIDELRFSDVIRYTSEFALPDSFSRNYRKGAAGPAVANGPPLLFDKRYLPNEAIKIGSRKHVFIDEVIIDKKQNVRLSVNPAGNPVFTNIKIHGDTPFFGHDGKIWTVQTPAYGSGKGAIRLFISEDGTNFQKPDLGVIEHDGSRHNNLLFLHVPCWGRFFKDPNPNIKAEERFKFTGWIAQRGIYLYFSPDAIHWRRNETCMLPFVSGGGCETFWDDQRGVYVNLLKRDGSYSTGDYPAYGRGGTLFETREVGKAWPFKKLANPYYEGWPYPAVTGEGITVFGPDLFNPNRGHVFRTRAVKYPWAPDTYVAFLARNAHTELAVSRDGIRWHIYDTDNVEPYLPRSLQVGGESVGLGWVQDGMVRRGDTIWQYSNAGGPNTVRLSQRLDGFVSLDAGEQTGTIITRPIVFDGEKLVLNAASKGFVKVGILTLPGREIAGFGVKDCQQIQTDSVRHVVSWAGKSNVGNLAGQVVRLRFEMQDAKLYAFGFE